MRSHLRLPRLVIGALVATAVTAPAVAALPDQPAAAAPVQLSNPSDRDWEDIAYRGGVEVVRDAGARQRDTSMVTGRVFLDRDRDSANDPRERGLGGVVVSNGRDVDTTDAQGRYQLPAYDNMTVSVTQPAGFQVPVDEHNVAQFHYHHLPQGSPELEFGGIAPTGPLPDAVNFPLVRSRLTERSVQECVIAGDLQTYDMDEVGYARRGAIRDLARRTGYEGCGSLFIGDVVGDDLSLYPEVKELTGLTNGPARFLPGNHDLDFDALSSDHSFDTFRAQLAPEYYSYDVGDAHVVALNTVRYPCTPGEDNADGQRPECDQPETNPRYNGAIDDEQLAWLEADLAEVPRDKLIVVASHIPLLGFADSNSSIHQVDQLNQVYALLEGREAVSVAGHQHTIENMKTGDLFKGWRDLFGIDGLPFPHITAGAISGDWYSGALTPDGYPVAVGRDGSRPGLLTLDIDGSSFMERYTVTGRSDEVQTQLGINSPTYRRWYHDRVEWNETGTGPAPELGDPHVVTPRDLSRRTWLTTNFWMGSTGSTVEVSIDGGPAVEAVRTQRARGEDQRVGPRWSDPHAVAQQLVQDDGSLADRSMHLWRYALPADLEPGMHRAWVTATDAYGRESTDLLAFKVVAER